VDPDLRRDDPKKLGELIGLLRPLAMTEKEARAIGTTLKYLGPMVKP